MVKKPSKLTLTLIFRFSFFLRLEKTETFYFKTSFDCLPGQLVYRSTAPGEGRGGLALVIKDLF